MVRIENLCYDGSLNGVILGQTKIIKRNQLIFTSKLNEKIIFEFYGQKRADNLIL